MVSKYYEATGFVKEKARWYAKLKRSGFEDIESPGGGINGTVFGDPRLIWDDGRGEYFYQAEHWYWKNLSRFTSKERRIWEMHKEDISIAAISRRVGLSFSKTKGFIRAEAAAMLASLREDNE